MYLFFSYKYQCTMNGVCTSMDSGRLRVTRSTPEYVLVLTVCLAYMYE
jgi:hypothetical protein